MKSKFIKIFNKYKKIILIGLTILILLITAIIFIPKLANKISTNPKKLEEKMSSLVKEYYDSNVKGKVFGINRYIVTIETMEKHGIDVSELTSDKAACEKKSFAYVLIENPTETDLGKIKYTVENHLTCKNYQSENNTDN